MFFGVTETTIVCLAMNKKQLTEIAHKAITRARTGTLKEAMSLARELLNKAGSPGWALATGFRYSVFGRGNSKLPFYSWSVLPILTCPGMGKCGRYCYSLKSWRYPTAYMRQLVNTIRILTPEGREEVAREFARLPKGATLRLHVDGDFESAETLLFWMGLLKTRPDIRAYTYSKSWHLFISAHKSGYRWPNNFMLNLSGGSRWDGTPLEEEIAKLPIVRGRFIAVDMKIKQSNLKGARKAVLEQARAQGIERAFVCPGKCGSCTSRGHACGLPNFKGIDIVIGTH